jgi:hypothetical protein
MMLAMQLSMNMNSSRTCMYLELARLGSDIEGYIEAIKH